MELIINQIFLIQNINHKKDFSEFDILINVPNKKNKKIKKLKFL